jgi:hypothetical protein
MPRLGRLQELLKLAVFCEDVGEGLVHYVVRWCMEKGGVLIDLSCGGFIQADGGLDVSDLGYFK